MPYSRLSSDISAVLPINIGPSLLYVIAIYIIPSYNIASYNVIRQAAHAKGAAHHRTWTVPENISRSGAKNWAVVSAKHAIRKVRPALSLNSGMRFPLKLLPENASHSERSFRDTASACGPVGKVHPALRARSEMQFPLEARSGNGIPLWGRNLGHSFRLRAVPESASRSERQFRVTVSSGTRRRSAALITCLQICDPETQNSR